MLQSAHGAEFESEVLASSQVVLVDFYATWCGPCRMLAPILEEMSEEFPAVKFLKVDVDEETSLASAYEIRNLPTLLVFKEGKVVARNVGSATKYEIENLFAPYL